jgi:two-component system, NtrC family, sensor histidine kinase PilS
MRSERRLRLFIYARIIVSFLFLASTILLGYREPATAEDLFRSGIVRLMAFSFLFSCASRFALRLRKFSFFIIYLQTIWDVLFVTLLLLFTGGILSPYSFIYLLAIMNAGVQLGRREALYTASLCGILYGAIVDFQYFGLLESIGLRQEDARQLGASHLFYTIFLNLMGFGLSAFITGYLSERARASEAALRENIINYEEISQLNTKLVSNIESGLLTTNTLGNVRVFNPYAEHLTGLSLADVYDRPLSTLFPELMGSIGPLTDTIRGEFEYINQDGLRMILGYSAAPFEVTENSSASAIISFRDITGIRRMEEALKRADRLAALGELSARMAHEIRNPLAAMSGSVQMLAEQGSIGGNDGRLLEIVLRESDRLNKLISEFLVYARPPSPDKVTVDLNALIEDLRLLLLADSRFGSVEIVNRVPPHLQILADSHQISQVFLNLLRNSAEAMSDGGLIVIESRFLLNGAEGFRKSPTVLITVTDSGPGIDAETAKHIFEPFWTSKADGTGLGLAVIYRIIEAHGGSISVESPPTGGCSFTIMLPV